MEYDQIEKNKSDKVAYSSGFDSLAEQLRQAMNRVIERVAVNLRHLLEEWMI